jgi:uncharacterized protein (DUF697 family)
MKVDELIDMFFSDGKAQNFLKKELDALEAVQVRIAVIGRSGVGKSSLINALYGEKVAETGSIETTEEPREYSVGGLCLVDLPGCGTQRFPKDSYVESMRLEQYDAFVLVVAKRVYEDDHFLMGEIRSKLRKDVHVVRSMVDQDVENARRDGKAPETLLDVLRADLSKHFPGHPRVWLVSSVYPRRFDFPAFEANLGADLTDLKRDKFVFAAQAYTEEQLQKKREVVSRYVKVFSGLAAANGFNPIPGVDIAADIAIVLNMNSWILKCYKLDAETLERIYGKSLTGMPSRASIVARRMISYGTGEFVKAALRRQLGRMSGKELAKWVPVVGQLAAAGVGYGLVHWMGQETVANCEQAVRDIIFDQLASEPDAAPDSDPDAGRGSEQSPARGTETGSETGAVPPKATEDA